MIRSEYFRELLKGVVHKSYRSRGVTSCSIARQSPPVVTIHGDFVIGATLVVVFSTLIVKSLYKALVSWVYLDILQFWLADRSSEMRLGWLYDERLAFRDNLGSLGFFKSYFFLRLLRTFFFSGSPESLDPDLPDFCFLQSGAAFLRASEYDPPCFL